MTAPVLELHHPDDEILAAFVDDRASDETREKVIAHLASCAECRDLVLMTSDIVAEETTVVPLRKSAGRWIAPLAAAAAIGGALFLIPDVRQYVFGLSPATLAGPTDDLHRRTTPGRFAVALPYNKHWVDRGDGTQKPDAAIIIRGIHARNEETLRPNARTSGIAQALVAASYDDFSAAIEDLRKALAQADGDERDAIAMDLAATLLGRDLYLRRDELGHPDADEALKLADEVWTRTKSPDAAWNRAAALEALGRDQEAIAAWQTYLELDPSSPWTDEARENLAYLQTEP